MKERKKKNSYWPGTGRGLLRNRKKKKKRKTKCQQCTKGRSVLKRTVREMLKTEPRVTICEEGEWTG